VKPILKSSRRAFLLSLISTPALTCEIPVGTIIQMLAPGWPDLVFHYVDDEATFVSRAFFGQVGGIEELYAFSSPSRPQIMVVAVDKKCVEGRSIINKEQADQIVETIDKYRTYKKVQLWKTNISL